MQLTMRATVFPFTVVFWDAPVYIELAPGTGRKQLRRIPSGGPLTKRENLSLPLDAGFKRGS
jgi:hypothetical protein